MRQPPTTDLRIAAIAARQGGVIARIQLLSLGLSAQAIDRRLRAGRLHRIHRGVYAVGHPLLSETGRRWAAVLACGADAVLSDRSAADAWGLRPSATATMHVSVGPLTRVRLRGIVAHRRSLFGDEVTELEGLPLTTPARTLVDLAAGGLRGRQLEAALDRAAEPLRVDFGEIHRLLERHAGRPGVPALGALLTRYAPGSINTLSVLEEIVLELCDEHGLPRPLVNAVVEGKRRDFYWPHARLVVEADGFAYHHSPAALDDDRERDVRLTLAGFTVLRFTYAQCTRRRSYVRDSLLVALGGHLASVGDG
jgi:hypothetical protein